MAIVAVEVISIVFVCSWIKPMHTIKARHKAQISYGLVVVAMLLVWTWLQKVERHPLPQVDPMRDDGKHWPAVLVSGVVFVNLSLTTTFIPLFV